MCIIVNYSVQWRAWASWKNGVNEQDDCSIQIMDLNGSGNRQHFVLDDLTLMGQASIEWG